MKLTVLTDNNTLINRDLFSREPGLSFFIEEGNTKSSFDTAYLEDFMKNAYKVDINLKLNSIRMSRFGG